MGQVWKHCCWLWWSAGVCAASCTPPTPTARGLCFPRSADRSLCNPSLSTKESNEMRYTGVIVGRTGGNRQTIASFATLLLLVAFSSGRARADDPAPAQKRGIEGYWLGTLRHGAIEMRLGFQIKKKGDGTLTATGDSIDQ